MNAVGSLPGGRAADASLPQVRVASKSVAHSTPGVPVIASGAPGVPEPTVGAVAHINPDAAPTVHQTSPAAASGAAAGDDPGWAASVTGRCAHYVALDALRAVHYGRDSAFGIDGVQAFVDPIGLVDGRDMPRCPDCLRRLAQTTPCPADCVCDECARPIRRGTPAMPDGLGVHREQLWAHQGCWRRRYAGI